MMGELLKDYLPDCPKCKKKMLVYYYGACLAGDYNRFHCECGTIVYEITNCVPENVEIRCSLTEGGL